jgi:hypothetical protein
MLFFNDAIFVKTGAFFNGMELIPSPYLKSWVLACRLIPFIGPVAIIRTFLRASSPLPIWQV